MTPMTLPRFWLASFGDSEMHKLFQGLGHPNSSTSTVELVLQSRVMVTSRFSDADAAWIANGGFKQPGSWAQDGFIRLD